MSNLKKLKFIVILFICQLIIVPAVLGAGIDTKGLDNQDQALMGQTSLAGSTDLASIISVLIKSILSFLGVIFLVLTIKAGFKWMMSEGNEEEIKKAKGSLTNAIIGLVIVLAAYAITYTVFTYVPFGGGSGGLTTTP